MKKQQLSQLWEKLKEGLITLKRRGFSIIMVLPLAKIAGFVSVFFLPRFCQGGLKLLTYVNNIQSYVMLFNGIGIINATLRYCAEDGDDEVKKGYFITSLKVGIFADILLVIFTTAAYLVIPFPYEGAKFQLVISSCLPIFYFLFTDIQLYFRHLSKSTLFGL